MEVARIPLVWIFFMIVPVFGKKVEHFTWLQLFGFMILFFGVVVYNELLVIPFWGFNKYTSKALIKREAEKNGVQEERRSLKMVR